MKAQRVGRLVKSAMVHRRRRRTAARAAAAFWCGSCRNSSSRPSSSIISQRRGMDGVAAEVAQEVGVLLEHDDVDAGAREQQARASCRPGPPPAMQHCVRQRSPGRHPRQGRASRACRVAAVRSFRSCVASSRNATMVAAAVGGVVGDERSGAVVRAGDVPGPLRVGEEPELAVAPEARQPVPAQRVAGDRDRRELDHQDTTARCRDRCGAACRPRSARGRRRRRSALRRTFAGGDRQARRCGCAAFPRAASRAAMLYSKRAPIQAFTSSGVRHACKASAYEAGSFPSACAGVAARLRARPTPGRRRSGMPTQADSSTPAAAASPRTVRRSARSRQGRVDACELRCHGAGGCRERRHCRRSAHARKARAAQRPPASIGLLR